MSARYWSGLGLGSVMFLAACGGGGSGELGSNLPSITAIMPLGASAQESSSWERVSSASGTLIADFEADADFGPRGWVYGDLGVPQAYRGSLDVGLGSGSARGASLKYDLGCKSPSWQRSGGLSCGHAVRLTKVFNPAISVSASSAISFDLRNPGANALIELAITDESGQTLMYRFDPRSIRDHSGAAWTTVNVPLSEPTAFGGGAGSGRVSGGIQKIAFAAISSGVRTPASTLMIDNVWIRPNSDFVFSLGNRPAVVAGKYFPTHVGRLAVAAHGAVSLTALDKAAEVGIKVVRRDLSWHLVERNGSYDFSAFDKWTTALKDRGMSVVWVLDYGHPEHGGGAPVSIAQRAAFSRYASAAASHYRGKNVFAYEVWNEPNYAHYWPNPSPEAYGLLFKDAASAVKASDPAARVVTGGVTVDSIRQLDFISGVASSGHVYQADAVAVHPYRKRKPETFAADLYPINQVLKSAGVIKPVWVSEWGYSSAGFFDLATYGSAKGGGAKRRQAVLTLRMVLTQIGANVPLMTVYDLIDDGDSETDREHNFGLLAANLQDNPAMTSLRTLNANTAGLTYTGPLSNVPPGLNGLRWDGERGVVVALWVDSPGSSMEIKLPTGTRQIQRWDGTLVEIGSGGGVRLTEGDGPVFVEMS